MNPGRAAPSASRLAPRTERPRRRRSAQLSEPRTGPRCAARRTVPRSGRLSEPRSEQRSGRPSGAAVGAAALEPKPAAAWPRCGTGPEDDRGRRDQPEQGPTALYHGSSSSSNAGHAPSSTRQTPNCGLAIHPPGWSPPEPAAGPYAIGMARVEMVPSRLPSPTDPAFPVTFTTPQERRARHGRSAAPARGAGPPNAVLHAGRGRQGRQRRLVHVERGEALGLVGESGCGKSVSALSLMRPDPEAAGPDRRGRGHLRRPRPAQAQRRRACGRSAATTSP